MPPPAPEPLVPPLVPVPPPVLLPLPLPLPLPVDGVELLLLPPEVPEGMPGLLLGDIVEPPTDPDLVPVASAPSPDAA